MTPKQQRDFESEWPALSRRLESFLARKGVPSARREDLVQETAVRLFDHWPSVDRTVPLGALACTIALNLLRDEARRTTPGLLGELPDAPSSYDLEAEGIARLELGRVARALRSLGPAHRAILLQEIGGGSYVEALTPDAAKMMRYRARRKLSEILQKMAGVFSYRLLRVFESGSHLLVTPERAFGAVACATCLFIGVGGSVVLTSPSAEAADPSRPPTASRLVGVPGEISGRTDAGVSLAGDVEPGAGANVTGSVADGRGTGGSKKSAQSSTKAGKGEGAPAGPVQAGGGTPAVSSDTDVAGLPDGSESPGLPTAPGAPGDPTVPGTPESPPAPGSGGQPGGESPTDPGQTLQEAAVLLDGEELEL